ncbi:MAG: homocysteine S-methyltransferase family protein [Nanoarchaeota archaeon]|nr:homocysteine S-methyltransferase family protein [Nanoarchaeota archaeon]
MKRGDFAKLLRELVLVLDGAMGTRLMRKCNEALNLSKPETIASIHKGYADAGAGIILTNTYGASRLKLGQHGLGEKTIEINKAAVTLARQAAPKALIAGDIGPLGRFIEPLGELTFDQAYEAFSEQAKALKEADMLMIETISDIKILKAAIIAARDNFPGPILVSMTFQEGRTSTGTDIETYVAIAEAFDIDAIGINCSDGPEGMLKDAATLAKSTSKPIFVKPNAGLPKIVDGKTVYTLSPEDFAAYAEKFHSLGINIMGGCCGTDQKHIKALADALKHKKPVERTIKPVTKLCSRLKTVEIKSPTLIVGERINPTNKKAFQDELKTNKTGFIREQALAQVSQGAALLDINVSVPGLDETANLRMAMKTVQSLVDAPLLIDSSDEKAVEAALKESDGRPMINSVNAKNLDMLKLAKRYGASVVVLPLDKDVPESLRARIEIVGKIINEALAKGLRKEDIILDPLVMTLATHPGIDQVLLDAVKEFRRMGFKTIMGVSNISHGLPERPGINSKFLTKAIEAGLDLAIIDPSDNIVQENTDIELFKVAIPRKRADTVEGKLIEAILFGDEGITGLVESALEQMTALKVNDILIEAMHEVGKRFKRKEYYLPQVLASAKAMKKAFSVLKPRLKSEGSRDKGTVVFATVENDIHDIGKNIVIALLESHSYKVIDLGTSVPKQDIIDAVMKNRPDILCLSALMTTTALEMEKVISELRNKNVKIPVLVGGAVITEEYSHKIHANYSKDALSAVKKVNELCTR